MSLGKPILSKILFQLNEQKAIAAARYLLSEKLHGKANYFKLLKLIFLADRYHVRNYLRPVTTDRYVAMEHGPVASFLYNVFKGLRASGGQIRRIPEEHFKLEAGAKEPNYEYLSQTDIEALNFAFDHFGHLTKWQLRDLVHAYPEWAQFEDQLVNQKSVDMSFEDFLENADPEDKEFKKLRIKDPFPFITPEEREFLKQELIESVHQLT